MASIALDPEPRKPLFRPMVRRTRNSEATRKALLDAGARMFAQHGYEATTLEALAAAAGVTKAMVRYHFSDKAGIYRAVLHETFDHIADAVAPTRDAPLAPEKKLALYVESFAAAIRERPHLGSLLISDYAAGRIAKDKPLIQSLARFYGTTRAILAEGGRAGAFRKMDAHLFHLWLVGAILMFVSSQNFRDDLAGDPPWRGPSPSFSKYVRMLQDIALKSVAKKA